MAPHWTFTLLLLISVFLGDFQATASVYCGIGYRSTCRDISECESYDYTGSGQCGGYNAICCLTNSNRLFPTHL